MLWIGVNLILLEPGEMAAGGDVRLSGARARHLLDVLKAVPGRQVRIGIVDGPRGTGTVTAAGDTIVELRCALEGETPARPPVDLLLALPRPKVLRRLWAQIAALGVGRIMLTNAARVERNYFDTHVLSPACYRPLLIEGLQQARDTRLPAVTVHRQFKVLLEDELDGLSGTGRRLAAEPASDARVSAVVSGPTSEPILLAVGPEGGWNAFETDLLKGHGFEAVSMGARTLRTDTACLALLALVHDALGRGPAGRPSRGCS